MRVDGRDMRPIWGKPEQELVQAIDQRQLPHEFRILDLKTVEDMIYAIQTMVVRGAPLIGVSGAWGVYLITCQAPEGDGRTAFLRGACNRLRNARPTAVNLKWAVDQCEAAILKESTVSGQKQAAAALARAIEDQEAENCRRIGENGLELIRTLFRENNGRTVNVLTHCNAGWLACVDFGTATAPIYAAHDAGIPVHVWVDETRPLNQGARLTAWELGKHGVPHTVITDNAGGHLMQRGMVDMVIVGTDRTTYTGDVANKIGTYLKALAAKDNKIPFYVALPSSTFDWEIRDGVKDIPIEERGSDEVRYIQGLHEGRICQILVPPENSPAKDYAFDVTPARLVTGFITEEGCCGASEEGIRGLFPHGGRVVSAG